MRQPGMGKSLFMLRSVGARTTFAKHRSYPVTIHPKCSRATILNALFLLVLIVAPLMLQHRANPNVQGFVKGAYGAAIGTILGASVLLGKIAVGD